MTDNAGDSFIAFIPADNTPPVKKRYPVRGLLWGILLGLGLTLLLVTFGVIGLDLIKMLITLIIGTGLGTVWSIFGPAKKPKY